MDNKTVTYFVIGTGIGIAGTIIALALTTKHKLEKTKVIIDASEKMPAVLRDMIYNAKILPIEIKTKTFLDILRGEKEVRDKTESIVKGLSQYLTFKIK